MKHRIAIDCRFAHLPVGLGRYARELVTALLSLNDAAVEYVLFVRSADEEWIPKNAPIVIAPFPHYSLAEQLKLPKLLSANKIDLLFSPHFNVPILSSVPFVVTIHDLILHRYPNQAGFLKRLAYRFLMQRAIKRAEHIIAVSQFTASEIRSIYGEQSNMTVVTEGISDRFTKQFEELCEEVRLRYQLEEEFFLYVGNAKEHKNVQMLIDAFGNTADDGSILVLVCHGPEVSRLQLHDRIRIISDVSDDDLPALYSTARCFVTASLYEGFCLPVLEARGCGCPVIATNGSAIPEVAGAHTILVEPTVEAFTEALQSPLPRADDQVLYGWQQPAKQTSAILTAHFYGSHQ